VGALVDKNWGVGVADGGNQIMVAVGSGVSVAGMGVWVARKASTAEQDVSSRERKLENKKCLKVIGVL
jgi:hypothetical protein